MAFVWRVAVVGIDDANGVIKAHAELESKPTPGEYHQAPIVWHQSANACGNGQSLAWFKVDVRWCKKVVAGAFCCGALGQKDVFVCLFGATLQKRFK